MLNKEIKKFILMAIFLFMAVGCSQLTDEQKAENLQKEYLEIRNQVPALARLTIDKRAQKTHNLKAIRGMIDLYEEGLPILKEIMSDFPDTKVAKERGIARLITLDITMIEDLKIDLEIALKK